MPFLNPRPIFGNFFYPQIYCLNWRVIVDRGDSDVTWNIIYCAWRAHARKCVNKHGQIREMSSNWWGKPQGGLYYKWVRGCANFRVASLPLLPELMVRNFGLYGIMGISFIQVNKFQIFSFPFTSKMIQTRPKLCIYIPDKC